MDLATGSGVATASTSPSEQPQVSPAKTSEPSQQSDSTKDDITAKSLEEKAVRLLI